MNPPKFRGTSAAIYPSRVTSLLRTRGPKLALLAVTAAWVVATALGFGACARSKHGLREVGPGECYTCHQADYEGATNPTHLGVYPTTCGECHSETAWRPASDGNHPDATFPISTGAHQPVECSGCHDVRRGPNTDGVNTICVGCHTGNHDRAEEDSFHAGIAGYPAGDAPPNFCLTCHPMGLAETVPHPEASFPLTMGPHLPFQCTECHDTTRGSNVGGANTDCVGCHTGDHDRAAMDLRHRGVHIPLYPTGPAAPNFCLTCHPTGLAPIPLHPEAAFPIAAAPHDYGCGDCHNPDLGSNVGGANTDCVGCHAGSHTRALMDTRHTGVPGYPAGAQPPSFCLTCHPTGSAATALHDEAAFPIGAGNHAGLECASCHDASLGSSIGGANTDCIGCHTGTHARTAMDARHAGVSGYPSGPAAPNFCLSCHPAGNADSVGHPEAAFPIATGQHSRFACNDCHNPALGSNIDGANTDCIGCHTGEHTRSRVDADHNEVSGYPRGDPNPHFCLECHPDGNN